MNEDKATRYHRLGRRVAFVSLICSAGALAALLATGASAGVRSVAASIAGGSPALTVAAYVALLSAAFDMALLPVSFYRSYLLEHRYQLSTQNAAHWLKDHIKSALVGLLFAEAGALFVYSAIARSPGSWWLAAGVAYSLVLVVLVNLGLSCFFRCSSLQAAGKGTLRDRLTSWQRKRRPYHGRVQVDPERSNEEGERGTRRDGKYAENSPVRHAARRIFG